MFTRRSFPILLLVGLLIAANLGAVTKVKGDEQNQLDSALTSVSFQLPFHGRKYILQGPFPDCETSTTHTSPPVREAIDFDMEVGTDIYAAEGGKIIWAGWYTPHCTYGNLVKILHTDGKTSWYAHLSDWDRSFVANQTYVAKGQWIGKSGDTTCEDYVPHLHFEVRDADNHAVWVRDIPGMHWHSGDPNNPCGVKQGIYYGYGDGPSLEQESNVTVTPDYIDYSTPSVTVRVRIRSRYTERTGALLWSLRVTDPRGGEHRWVAPVCYDGFDPGTVRDCTFTFEVPDYRDKVCRYSGAYRVNALEYGISTGSLEPAEWIALQNPNHFRSGSCLNACCASGASAVQGAQLQGCPNYCGGQPGWTPTPTPRPVYTPTSTPQPPPDGQGITLYEFDNCRGLYDQFQSNGCHNLINARNADSFTANFAQRKHIVFYEGAGCNPAARQDDWRGQTTNGCQPLPRNIKGFVGSIKIEDDIPSTPQPGQVAITVYQNNSCGDGPYDGPQTGMYQCHNLTYGTTSRSFRLQTNRSVYVRFYTMSNCSTADRQWGETFSTSGCYQIGEEVIKNTKALSFVVEDPPITPTSTPIPRPTATGTPTRTRTPVATATIGSNQKVFGGYVYQKDSRMGIAGVSLCLHYYLPEQGRWVGAGDTKTDANGYFLLRTQHTATQFVVTVTAIPAWAQYAGVIIRHDYAKKADDRAIVWTLPSGGTVGLFESDFLLSGQPTTATPTTTRTPTRTMTPRPTSTATLAPRPCAPIVILDWPWEGLTLFPPIEISGWAIDVRSQEGTGISYVVFILTNPMEYPLPRLVEYGLELPGIARDWGEQFRYSGYKKLLNLLPGDYRIRMGAETDCGSFYWDTERRFTVVEPKSTPTPLPPNHVLHHVNQPQEQGYYANPFDFSGWTCGLSGERIDRVEFYLDLPKGQVAMYGLALCNEYVAGLPDPYKNSAWHYSFNPAWVNNGWHKVYVYAVDDRGRDLAVIVRNILTVGQVKP